MHNHWPDRYVPNHHSPNLSRYKEISMENKILPNETIVEMISRLGLSVGDKLTNGELTWEIKQDQNGEYRPTKNYRYLCCKEMTGAHIGRHAIQHVHIPNLVHQVKPVEVYRFAICIVDDDRPYIDFHRWYASSKEVVESLGDRLVYSTKILGTKTLAIRDKAGVYHPVDKKPSEELVEVHRYATLGYEEDGLPEITKDYYDNPHSARNSKPHLRWVSAIKHTVRRVPKRTVSFGRWNWKE